MAERTVAELIAFARAAQAKAAPAGTSWIKPDPIYPTISQRVTQDTHAGHTALDLAAPMNSPVKAVYPGVVERVVAGDPRGYGNLVIIKQPDSTRAYYAHLNAFGVLEGQAVRAGQAIGLADSTGNSSGSHLHLEFRTSSGTPINPHKYFATDFKSSEFRGAAGRAEYGASEMIGRQVIASPYQNLAAWTPPGVPASARPGDAGTAYLPAGSTVATAATIEKEEGAIKLFTTPIGDVSVADFPWMRIAAVGFGLVLVWIAVIALLRPQIKKVGKKVAKAAIPLAAGAVGGPVAGVVAGIAT